MRRPSTFERSSLVSDIVLTTLAVVIVPVLHLANRWSLRRTTTAVSTLAAIDLTRGRLRPDAEAVARAAKRAGHLIGRHDSSCLARSQFVWLMLASSGRSPRLWLGAGSGFGSGGRAHAWVELDGVPIGEPIDVAAVHPPFDHPLLPLRPSGLDTAS